MNGFKSFLQNENEVENKKGKTIYIDYDRIVWLKNKDFKEFTSFKLKGGKNRKCYKSDNEDDKEILEIIYQYIVKNLVPKVNYKKSIIRITKQIQGRLKRGYRIIFKTDIDNFFESIDHEILIMKVKKLEDELLDDYIYKFIKAFKKSNNNILTKGIPTGINLTQILSEFYLMEFESNVRNYCKINDFYYYRYCDDILILGKRNKGKKEREDLINIVKKNLGKLKLKINKDKTINAEKEVNSFNYLGFIHSIKKPTLSLSEQTINSIKGKITSRFLNALCFINEYITKKEYKKVPLLYKRSMFQLNRLIKGSNKKWENIEKFKDIIPYGLAPLMYVINNYEQIEKLEKWLGKIVGFYKNFIFNSMKIYTKLDYTNMFHESENIESLKNWIFRYKKDFLKTAIRAIYIESTYESVYKGGNYRRGGEDYVRNLGNEINNALSRIINIKNKANKEKIMQNMNEYHNKFLNNFLEDFNYEEYKNPNNECDYDDNFLFDDSGNDINFDIGYGVIY